MTTVQRISVNEAPLKRDEHRSQVLLSDESLCLGNTLLGDGTRYFVLQRKYSSTGVERRRQHPDLVEHNWKQT
ncbi:unnamed protein product [Gongylonema pulchrum]|uniref:Transposase n=1 Tax=Gongylonema pulchrum TaxID=637853 RepID=A0A183DFC3_9BILA|nr:unnamed protein product [Gongylonema pulchrum]